MLRAMLVASLACAAIACGGAPSASAVPVAVSASHADAIAHAAAKAPSVRCYRLDRAKDKLRAAGYRVRVRGGGLFGVVVESNWVVVSQAQSGSRVTVYVDRSC